jgi:hypothetical protein
MRRRAPDSDGQPSPSFLADPVPARAADTDDVVQVPPADSTDSFAISEVPSDGDLDQQEQLPVPTPAQRGHRTQKSLSLNDAAMMLKGLEEGKARDSPGQGQRTSPLQPERTATLPSLSQPMQSPPRHARRDTRHEFWDGPVEDSRRAKRMLRPRPWADVAARRASSERVLRGTGVRSVESLAGKSSSQRELSGSIGSESSIVSDDSAPLPAGVADRSGSLHSLGSRPSLSRQPTVKAGEQPQSPTKSRSISPTKEPLRRATTQFGSGRVSLYGTRKAENDDGKSDSSRRRTMPSKLPIIPPNKLKA